MITEHKSIGQASLCSLLGMPSLLGLFSNRNKDMKRMGEEEIKKVTFLSFFFHCVVHFKLLSQ